MPRLILIEGPRSGDYFQLAQENYLGFRSGSLALSYANDVQGAWGLLRGDGERYELANLGPRDRIQVNGEAIQAVWLHHGDLIAVAGSLMIFDQDESGAVGDGAVALNAPAIPVPVLPAYAPAPAQAQARGSGAYATQGFVPIIDDGGPDTKTFRREEVAPTTINYRQKHYQDHDAVLKGIADARRIKTLLKVSSKITTILDLNELLTQLLEILFAELPADRGSILLFDGDTRRLRTMAAKARRGGANPKVRISKTIVKEVLKSKETILSADAQNDARFNLGPQHRRGGDPQCFVRSSRQERQDPRDHPPRHVRAGARLRPGRLRPPDRDRDAGGHGHGERPPRQGNGREGAPQVRDGRRRPDPEAAPPEEAAAEPAGRDLREDDPGRRSSAATTSTSWTRARATSTSA